MARADSKTIGELERLREISNGLLDNAAALQQLKKKGGDEPKWQRHRKDPRCGQS